MLTAIIIVLAIHACWMLENERIKDRKLLNKLKQLRNENI